MRDLSAIKKKYAEENGENPFTLSFGRIPELYIVEQKALEKIAGDFLRHTPVSYAYMIIGVRGSGKTVLMQDIKERFANEDDWLCIELSSSSDMLLSTLSKLGEKQGLLRQLSIDRIDLSSWGIGVSIKNSTPVQNEETAVEHLLRAAKKTGKRVLICVDEAANTRKMREFASVFQRFVRDGYPVYLIMTGLYDNIKKIKDEANLTFLYRVPRIPLEKLNFTSVKKTYRQALNVDEDAAAALATIADGYSYAFQLLGYLWRERNAKEISDIIYEFDERIARDVYDKIWEECSPKDREFLTAIASSGDGKVKSVRSIVRNENGETASTQAMNQYRQRLCEKGLVTSRKRGELEFTLPRFREYITEQSAE